MDTVILTWNFANWVTVMLMAVVGYLLLALLSNLKYLKREE